jgi:hypothetical protein
MTKEQIIEMAKKCGWEEHQVKYDTRFEPFAKLVAEKEREKCARIADEWVLAYPHPSKSIAELIRKRGQE